MTPIATLRPSPRAALLALGTALCAACDTPETPRTLGSLHLSTAAASTSCGALTSGVVHIAGPTAKTLTIQPGKSDTVAGLVPGTYTVGLEGLINSDVDCFGQTSGVPVVKGETSTVTVTLVSFPSPALDPISAVTFGRDLVVAFTLVSGAVSYVLADSLAGHTAQTTATTATTVPLTLADTGSYLFSVRAVDPYGSTGRASALVPTFVDSLGMVSAGNNHTCVLSARRGAYCWGADTAGQVGSDSTGRDRLRPGPVVGGLSFTSVSAGWRHTCALTPAGAAYCWGDNTFGQLGDGTLIQRLAPTAVSGGHTFSVVTVGNLHSCALTTAGAAYCWGSNGSGQLGDSTTTQRQAPVLVHGGLTFTALSAGGTHTCGLTSSGAYCWGDNTSGAIGDGTIMQRMSPVPVASSGVTFAGISAGSNLTCGLTSAGNAYCWGDNALGQVGSGDSVNQHSTPFPVAGGLAFAIVSAGHLHACGVTKTGAGYCWGNNGSSELGIGVSGGARLVPTAVTGSLTFVTISAALSSNYPFSCGLTSTGAAYCWGWNGSGELGSGTTVESSTPGRVVNP